MPAKSLNAIDVALPLYRPGSQQDGEAFSFSSHARAREAIEFGLSIHDFGFNIFVLGAENSGRMTATLDFLNASVADMAPADDIVYLNHFVRSHRPKPYRLPAGMARKFRDHMTTLVPQLREAFVQAFGGKDYEHEILSRRESMNSELAGQLDTMRADARTNGLDIVQTENGMMVVATNADGEAVALDTFEPQERGKLKTAAKGLGERLSEFNRSAAKLNVEFMSEAANLNRQIADSAVGDLIDKLEAKFSAYAGLRRWIVEFRADIVEHLQLFRPPTTDDGSPMGETAESRYAVNLFVDNGDEDGPSVIVEPNPTYENLFGRIEYRPVAGLLETDFSMIRAGALHRANGGILVLRAESLARNPMSWELLKGALRDREFRLEELHRTGALPIAGAPNPKPVPLDLNIVIVGSPQAYYAFFSVDPEFRIYFKVKADIDSDMDTSQENIDEYGGLIRAMARSQGDECSNDAIVRLLGEASRSAAHRRKLTSRYELMGDVLNEAARHVPGEKPRRITAEAVSTAFENRHRRNSRVEDRMQEGIAEGTMMIDTDGEVIGQINALVVRDLGDHAFGSPSRVTARASAGRLGVINVERDTELGGPIQQKGVMVLQGFLAGHFALRIPLSFNCSITFEQSYGGVEGDSASMAELCAVLSTLSGLPLRQDLAITGSVNQRGQSQPIGGAIEKIEGFFRTCFEAAPLTGSQGVIIPASNAANVLLRQNVVEAITSGKFRVYSVESIEEAIELLTGIPAGEADCDNNYPPDSVYGKVVAQLEAFNGVLLERGRSS
jgi:predicted ATP-dependent protease